MNYANFYWISITSYIPVTVKMATRSKPDVASVWRMQCAWVISRHRENDWRVVGMQAVDINYYKLSEICLHAKIDAFVTSWGCAQSKEAIQDHWLVDNSTASGFGVYAIVTKMQALMWILLYSLHHRIRTIVQPEDSHMPYQRNYCYIVPVVTYPRINPYVNILIWSYP